ncbi:PAC2 family protein [uncultured archaeon]|nr:PAC2 family protein [uncultured archaeon]
MSDIIVREIEKIKLKKPILIEGFPGIGMIGTIACSYMNDKLGLKLIGCITSDSFPPIASVHDYKPVYPIRIYASEEHDLILIYSEMIIPMEEVQPLTRKILEYAHEKDVEMIVSLAGIQVETPTDKLYGIISNKELMIKLTENQIEAIKEGSIQGVSGTLVAECSLNEMHAINLLAQTNMPLDPRGAAMLIEKLGKIINLQVDTSELIKEATTFEKKIKDNMNQIQENTKSYEKLDNPMYA